MSLNASIVQSLASDQPRVSRPCGVSLLQSSVWRASSILVWRASAAAGRADAAALSHRSRSGGGSTGTRAVRTRRSSTLWGRGGAVRE